MDYNSIKLMLESTGYPVKYNAFAKAKEPPFIRFKMSCKQWGSDQKNLIEEISVRVELYTAGKNIDAENKIKKLLNSYEFENDEVYIESERLTMNVYSFSHTQKIKEAI